MDTTKHHHGYSSSRQRVCHFHQSKFSRLTKYSFWYITAGGVYIPNVCSCNTGDTNTHMQNMSEIDTTRDNVPVSKMARDARYFKNRCANYSQSEDENNEELPCFEGRWCQRRDMLVDPLKMADIKYSLNATDLDQDFKVTSMDRISKVANSDQVFQVVNFDQDLKVTDLDQDLKVTDLDQDLKVTDLDQDLKMTYFKQNHKVMNSEQFLKRTDGEHNLPGTNLQQDPELTDLKQNLKANIFLRVTDTNLNTETRMARNSLKQSLNVTDKLNTETITSLKQSMRDTQLNRETRITMNSLKQSHRVINTKLNTETRRKTLKQRKSASKARSIGSRLCFGKPVCCNSVISVWKKSHFATCMLIHILNVVRNIRNVAQAFLDGSDKIFALSEATFQVYFAVLFFLTSYAHRQHFVSMVTEWLKYEAKYGVAVDMIDAARRSKWFFAWAMSVVSIQTTVLFVGILLLYDSMYLQQWPFSKYEQSGRYILAFFVGGYNFAVSITQFGASSIQNTIIYILIVEFRQLSHKLQHVLASTSTEASKMEENFDSIVEQLDHLNGLVEKSYHVVKHTIAMIYFFTLPLYCFSIYGIVTGVLKWDQAYLVAFSLFVTSSSLIITCFGCGTLYKESRSVWTAPYAVSWKTFSPAILRKLSVFMNQLSVQETGFSVYGMFTVTMSTLLMMMGTLLSYGIMVVQFQLDAADRCPAFNGTI